MTVRDITARVRRTMYIPGGNRLAKAVANRCMVCRRTKRVQNKQIMGDLPGEQLSATAPFVFTALDMFGPWQVRELAKGRRYFKCWDVMFTCLTTKAVCILACPGYSTATFTTTYRRFCAIYGEPSKVFADHGPQLVAHAGAEELSLGQVAEEAGRRGTKWSFSPKACSWRNGQAEVCIRLARHTLSHLLSSASTEPMDVHSLDATFLEVAAILNRRPIAVRYSSSTDFHAISPADILLGRAHWLRPDVSSLPHLPQDLSIQRAISHQQEVVAAWREQWLAQAFPEMVPRTAWKQKYRSVRVGDVGHMLYKAALGKSAYRLCRVISTSPDTHGVVRTCTVGFRPRHRAEQGEEYQSKELTTMIIGVQRFAVLLPLELQTDENFSLTPRRASPNFSPAAEEPAAEKPGAEKPGAEMPGAEKPGAEVRPESSTPPPHPLTPAAPRGAPAGWQGGRVGSETISPTTPSGAPTTPSVLSEAISSFSRRPSPQSSPHSSPSPLTQEFLSQPECRKSSDIVSSAPAPSRAPTCPEALATPSSPLVCPPGALGFLSSKAALAARRKQPARVARPSSGNSHD